MCKGAYDQRGLKQAPWSCLQFSIIHQLNLDDSNLLPQFEEDKKTQTHKVGLKNDVSL